MHDTGRAPAGGSSLTLTPARKSLNRRGLGAEGRGVSARGSAGGRGLHKCIFKFFIKISSTTRAQVLHPHGSQNHTLSI